MPSGRFMDIGDSYKTIALRGLDVATSVLISAQLYGIDVLCELLIYQ